MGKKKFITAKVVNESLRLALRERDATRAIELFLEHMGERSHSERIYIFEGEQGCSVDNTFEWCAEGVEPQKDNLQKVPFEAVEWWYQAFKESRSILIYDLEDICEKEPLTYKYLKPQNVHSLIASPLELEGKIIGFYGVDNPPAEAMEDATYFAEIVGHFIVSLLEKQRLMQQMEKLSFEDSLSGVQNRHALNDYIEYHRRMDQVGIVYCDVLGLKKVNDLQGHQAGDALIIRASNSLKNNFRKKDVYRIGGDEFLVLCKDISKDMFWSKVEALREDMKKNDAMMSLGAIWRESVSDVDGLIAEADGIMYKEKRAYYAALK
ncbi:MAG: GGDEF domain-containing protein [Lachnospiraceae bacterium]|nr:GGDEF domain-containing protein [Lachnospiraceae bacterium]